jgi:signal peptidase I
VRRLLATSRTLLLAAGVLLGLGLVVPAVLGYQRYVIVSGSMTGTYDRGYLVFDEVVPVEDLRTGDVITYRPPPGSGAAGLVTHRIAEIRHVASRPVFRTRGDANPVADPWTFTLPGPTQARVVAGVPYVGYLLAALSDRRVRMLLVGVPALLIAVSALAGLWREAGAETAGSTA